MGDTRKKEERAFDALIVSQLRKTRDIMKLDDLPPLSDDELAAMDGIPADIIPTMWAEECSGTGTSCEMEEEDDCALAGAGDSSLYGMDRSTKMDEDDKATLDESRDDAREEIKKRQLKANEKNNG